MSLQKVTGYPFNFAMPMHEFMYRGNDSLIDKYWCWYNPHFKKWQYEKIDANWINRDVRFFDPSFIIHHNLHVGI
jgi:hypothetical protein